MSTISARVQNVRVYSNGDSIRYRVTFDQMFDAITKNENDEYVEAKVDYIDFVPRVIIAQCLGIIDGLDILYTKKKEQGLRMDGTSGFGAAELQVVLKGAICSIERTKFEAGEEYTDADGVVQTHNYAGYNTSIVEIKVSERIQAKLDRLIDSVLGL